MYILKICSTFILLLLFGKTFPSNNLIVSYSDRAKPIPTKFRDINGKVYQIRNKVFVFMDVECPISQFYTKSLQKLSIKYAMVGVIFITVFPTKYVNENEIIAFNHKYNLTIPSVLDKFQSITKKLNASVTPEVIVVNQNNEISYSGSIDDSYFALGKRNLNPKKNYLEDALNSIIKNQKPLIPHSNAIGCEIQRIP